MTRPIGKTGGVWICTGTVQRDAIEEADGLNTGDLAQLVNTTTYWECTDASLQDWADSVAPGAGTVPVDGVDSTNIVDGSIEAVDLGPDVALTGATPATAGNPGTAPAAPAGSMFLVLNGDGTYAGAARPWAAGSTYAAQSMVVHLGVLYWCPIAFTAGASFNVANWTNLSAGSVAPVSDHSILSNLNVGDPHLQYLPVDGSRSPTSTLDMGGHVLRNIGSSAVSTDAASVGLVEEKLGADWFYMRVSADTGILLDEDVPFDKAADLSANAGKIIPDSAEPFFELKAGVSYLLMSQLAGDLASGSNLDIIGEPFAWVDIGSGDTLSSTAPLRLSSSDQPGFGGDVFATVVQPTEDIFVSLKLKTNYVSLINAGSWAIVRTIGIGPSGAPPVAPGTFNKRTPLVFGDQGTPVPIGSTLPANAQVVRWQVSVTESFDDPLSVIQIGKSGVQNEIGEVSDPDDLGVTWDHVDIDESSTQLTVLLTGSANSQGAASVTVDYILV